MMGRAETTTQTSDSSDTTGNEQKEIVLEKGNISDNGHAKKVENGSIRDVKLILKLC